MTAKSNITNILKDYSNLHIALYSHAPTQAPKSDHWTLILSSALNEPSKPSPTRQEYQLTHSTPPKYSSTPAPTVSKARTYIHVGRVPTANKGDLDKVFGSVSVAGGYERDCQNWVVGALEALRKEKWAEIYVEGSVEEVREWIYD
ncbi:hypothetical protein HDV00_011222 [Rhizophlyctis rosea]|nr:hypothetical protein HDV00_011222 [Rhizophlyctis rosea]